MGTTELVEFSEQELDVLIDVISSSRKLWKDARILGLKTKLEILRRK